MALCESSISPIYHYYGLLYLSLFKIITVTRVSILQNLPEFLLYQNDPVKTVATFYPKLGGGTNSK